MAAVLRLGRTAMVWGLKKKIYRRRMKDKSGKEILKEKNLFLIEQWGREFGNEIESVLSVRDQITHCVLSSCKFLSISVTARSLENISFISRCFFDQPTDNASSDLGWYSSATQLLKEILISILQSAGVTPQIEEYITYPNAAVIPIM